MEQPLAKRNVILVDELDRELGLIGILEAHKGFGRMHRAISILIHDGNGNLLLQQRSRKKLLWPGYWTNTVCTHPNQGEGYLECATRRLREEMGIKISSQESVARSQEKLKIIYRFRYQAQYDREWSENELDTVMVGKYSGEVVPNPEEAMDYEWVDWEEVKKDVVANSGVYTPWFRLIVAANKVKF